jgi:hypothetical protein
VVLAQGQLPVELTSGIKQVEEELASRRARLTAGAGRLTTWVPRLAVDAAIVRKPVLGDDRFVWGDVLISGTRPEGIACSQLVVDLLRSIDGVRTIEAVIDRVAAAHPAGSSDQIKANLLFAIQTLFVEGAIEELSGL